jgi:hypothetical protein
VGQVDTLARIVNSIDVTRRYMGGVEAGGVRVSSELFV